ncbi:Tfp pilus assembly protein FimT/FimU [Polynucleobacter sp. JS-Fieb-80-E5]|uniref:pilus assembly FimT family protein n=1 Tax=Polynucleobacter sp. JS-Fieb-80-E5 TaxID=2081050 RepID=UPI001C0CD9CB|nr:prepilin-type N-terminal cleavage/methylation domain-containing protein [Polynucleobacter sp. JS-Fieb-80-E5]MBU3619628.1 prepilin-type N-terminal cleavage/methylation domain-containing protein [Polynucleobacter sp. JS-Fieb-80-E5]
MSLAMAQMVSQAEPETMPTLAIGSKSLVAPKLIRLNVEVKSMLASSSSKMRRAADAGFTLIELLVAIAIMAVMLGVAVLAIPNHDERYWKDNLDQLVSSLNLAQDESAMSGTPMIAQIDSVGWRFFVPNSNGAYGSQGSAGSMGSSASGGQSISLSGNGSSGAVSPVNNPSGLMPDVYRPQSWYKPVEIAPLQLTLGGEQVAQVLQIPIKQVTGSGAQDIRQAVLIRNRNGRFSWTK